ncbi:MAG: xanthine dehydrogenase family protein molybdopterin-binding subunit [Chloroflexi bacterium]|nr:xanthine dehydrogenase family protein molybdopterin-binding subunit [Chloroflexota bacterium]MBV9895585.1 xanthine dehydrogenase family protein molybdopterin-binding subunit [Chloroflexota bacterium]
MPYIGQPIPRLEDARLVTGAGQYTDDFRLPGQVYAAFVRSPHAHARLLRIGSEAAAVSPGVLAVLTGADYAADGHGPIPHGAQPTDATDARRPAFQYLDGQTPFEEAQPPLATDHVRYIGEPVAVVIAETAAQARDAADLVEVEYAVLPAVADVHGALAPDAPLVTSEVAGNVALDGIHGDQTATEAALSASKVVVEHEFRNQRVANAQMEPRSAIGTYDSENDQFVMIAGSQGVTRQHAALSAALRLPAERIRVVCPDVGGGFGPRSYLQSEQVAVVWAAKRVGRPVRWTSNRSEAFLSDQQGRDSTATLRIGFDEDGRIQALAADCIYNLGAYTVGGYVPIANFSRILCSIYDIPNACVRMRGVLTNTGCTGPFRGAGRPEAMFMLERMLDLAAAQLGMDRVQLRRQNLIPHDRLPYRTALGLTYDSGDFLRNMELALELSDWTGFPARRTEAISRGVWAGIGVANYVEAPVGAPHERVYATVNTDEQVVELVAGTQSTGQGHATSFAQVLADQLGVRPSQVRLVTGDTDVVTSGGGTHSDRSMRLAGTLIVQACDQLRAQCRQVAASLFEVAPEDIVQKDDAWMVAGTDRSMSVFELARTTRLSAEAKFTGRIPAHPTGCAVCELEVDPETGGVRITRYTAVDDVGQAINPLILHGQVAGGIAQGVGQALLEHLRYDPETAQLVTGSWLDYAMPRAADLPDFALQLTEDPTPGNPLRVKGGGEAGITPCLAAVVNAAVDALRHRGVQHLEMPLTPARVWQALASAGYGAQDFGRQQPA